MEKNIRISTFVLVPPYPASAVRNEDSRYIYTHLYKGGGPEGSYERIYPPLQDLRVKRKGGTEILNIIYSYLRDRFVVLIIYRILIVHCV